MRIRTQLIVAFLLLSVLPLSGIVLYNYVTSKEALEEATQTEADALTRQMQERMGGLRQDLAQQTGMFGDRFWNLLQQGELEEKNQLAKLVSRLGDTEGMIESFVFVPHEVPEPPAPPDPNATESDEVRRVIQEELAEQRRENEEILRALGEQGQAVEISIAEVIRLARDEARQELEQDENTPLLVKAGLDAGLTWLARMIEQQETAEKEGAKEDVAKEKATADKGSEEEKKSELRLETSAGNRILRRFPVPSSHPKAPSLTENPTMRIVDVAQELERNGQIVGHISPRVNAEAVVGHVLRHTDRERGEIPFAIDRNGNLFTTESEDQQLLEAAGLRARWSYEKGRFEEADSNEDPELAPALANWPVDAFAPTSFRLGEDWAVVTAVDPQSGLSWGIASPLGDSLERLRTTTFRNFLTGLGLIALAMFGILPLSRRMTRHLDQVTAGAERIAHGDLDVRLPETSRDEFGKMARVFNRMAGDLKQQQSRLIEEQQQRRAQEVEQRLLQAELERKSGELEAARLFQLSMLPKSLPETKLCDLAVEMRTATEVGGDYYDFALHDETLHDEALTIAIGDATGHGATAGRMVTVIKSLFTAWQGQGELKAFLADVQRAVKRMHLGRMAMALALVRLERGRLTVTSAGMPPLLIARASTGEIEEVAVAGMPLGGLDEVFSEQQVSVEPGDMVVLMTDGLPELPDSAGEPLGYEAVRERLARSMVADPSAQPLPNQIIEDFLAQIDLRTQAQPPQDDVTFIVLRIR